MKNLIFNIVNSIASIRIDVVIILGLIFIFAFAGCADVSPNTEICVTTEPYGFWGGLWHGMILFFSFVGSLFSDDICVYAYDNNGGLYDLGFLLGVHAPILTVINNMSKK